MPSSNRKREREGGQDSARPKKKKKSSKGASASTTSASTSASASASTATSASALASNPPPTSAAPENSDRDALICPYNGDRKYDEWKRMMYGHPRVIPGGGALFPTNYQIDFRHHSDPWMCPVAECKKCFQQPSQLGLHFSRTHRKKLLYDEVRRGFFWEIGGWKTPDKDGRFRSIVVKRGYFAPDNKRKRGDVREPPEDWESYINPTAVKDIKSPNLPQPTAAPIVLSSAIYSSTAASAASASRPSATPAIPTPRIEAAPVAGPVGRLTGNSIQDTIDISSDEEDVRPSWAELQRESHSATSGPRRVEPVRVAQSSVGSKRDTQENPFQDDSFLSNNPVEPVHDHNGAHRYL